MKKKHDGLSALKKKKCPNHFECLSHRMEKPAICICTDRWTEKKSQEKKSRKKVTGNKVTGKKSHL